MTPADLSAALLSILAKFQGTGALAEAALPAEISIERPKNRDHGDWATNVAMKLAGSFGMNPRAFAEVLAPEISALAGVEKVDIAGPGFINITLSAAAAGELARNIVNAGKSYGLGSDLAGLKMNLEFVSANPTGPIHIGGARWAAVGDSLARLFEAQGATVTREYYFNDHGAQIDRFANSLLASALGEPTPEDGYGGEYIHDIAARVLAETAVEVLTLPRSLAHRCMFLTKMTLGLVPWVFERHLSRPQNQSAPLPRFITLASHS